MNSPVYNGTIFSNFFTDQNLTPNLNKIQLRSCDEIPRDDGLISVPTTQVNGNDPQCKNDGFVFSTCCTGQDRGFTVP